MGLSTVTVHLITLVIILIIYYKRVRRAGIPWLSWNNQTRNKFKEKQPKGLEALPTIRKPYCPFKLIGNIFLLFPLSKLLKSIQRTSLEYEDCVKFYALNETYVVLNTAPLAKTILKSSDYGHLNKDPVTYGTMRPFISNSVLTSRGDFWRNQRRILMKTQKFSALKAYVGMINQHSVNFVSELDNLFGDGAPHTVFDEINSIFLKISIEMITGYNLESSQEISEYHHNFELWTECVAKRLINPLLFFDLFWKLHPMSWKSGKAVKAMSEFARKRIQEHRARKRLLQSVGICHQGDSNHKETRDSLPFRSVLDELVDAGVNDEQIIDEVNVMMFGGHETSASTIHFFCFMMALNPSIQRECQQEIDQLFEINEKISFDSLQNDLKFLERCILETLRLYPPIFMFIRRLTTPLDIERRGETFRIPNGTSAVIFPYLIHRKEEYYPDPETFNPDRFLPEEMAKRSKYAYLPFSQGPRNCLGQKFGQMSMKIVAAHLLRNFEITTKENPEDVPIMPYTSLTPARNYVFNFKKRNI